MPLLQNPETGERVDASPEGAEVLRKERGYVDAEPAAVIGGPAVNPGRRVIVDNLDAAEYDAASPDRIRGFIESGWRTYAEKVLAYEREHQNRPEVVEMIEARLEELPDASSDHPEAHGQVVGSADHAAKVLGTPSSVDRPAKSASREEWDAYARAVGLDPEEYSNKDDLIEAVDKAEQNGGADG